MKHYFLLFCCCSLSLSAFSQKTIIKGTLTDKSSKEPIAGANITLVDTYDGATSDDKGAFQFESEETGRQVLQVTYLGYDSLNQPVTLSGGTIDLNLTMKEGYNELKVVVISAGAFEASDERKVTVLKPLDIVTTASAGGDTYGALRTLPGAQVSTGDQEGLFVRGGTGSEAQTFIDGMLVRNPFFASTPDYASRGRFNPFLFKGTVFSTGGYSAQYGQGMSSALVLETQDLPERSAGNIGISSVGLSYGQQKLWSDKGRAAGGNINYTNLAPYFLLIKQVPDFIHKPEFVGTEGFFRQQTKHNGMLKFYGYYNYGRVGFRIPGPNDQPFEFDVQNNNVYSNLSWAGVLGDHWKLNLGTSFSHDWSKIASSYAVQPDTFKLGNSLAQVRAVATRYLGKLTAIRFGAEYQFSTDGFKNNYFKTDLQDNYLATFGETDLYLSTKLVARLGARMEYNSLINKANIAPRVSLAYKLGDADQVSFAWGHFYQKGDSLLRWRSQYPVLPGFQRAEHYIVNYQFIQAERTFRVEGFYKKYTDLITTGQRIANDGKGYAQGLELFFRDKKSLKGVDYWISYSWLDTKRRFQWYPAEVQPTYAANHMASIVAKKFFLKLRTNVSVTYSYATGRPYYNPNRPQSEFLVDRTPNYQNLSMNVSYLTEIRGAFTVFVAGLSNITGNDQIFGYRYAADGKSRMEITPGAKRFFFVGCFASWGIDRRQEVIDKQN